MTTATLLAAARNGAPALRRLLGGSALALLCSTLLAPGSARAAAEYCQTESDGSYVCIEKVMGYRHDRGVIYTVNGRVYASRINCYSYAYTPSSIAAIACWGYGG